MPQEPRERLGRGLQVQSMPGHWRGNPLWVDSLCTPSIDKQNRTQSRADLSQELHRGT